TALTRNMSDIYVQYEATVSVTHSVWRIIVKVPRGKIDRYRIDHGDQSSDDTTIARKLSEEPAKRTPYLAHLSTYSLGVSYSDTFPSNTTSALLRTRRHDVLGRLGCPRERKKTRSIYLLQNHETQNIPPNQFARNCARFAVT